MSSVSMNQMEEVASAMEAISSTKAWWNDQHINAVIQRGVDAGWLSRLSTTQVHWTQRGVDAENARAVALQAIAEAKEHDDTEGGHRRADAALCNLLTALGFGDVAREFESLPKWYA